MTGRGYMIWADGRRYDGYVQTICCNNSKFCSSFHLIYPILGSVAAKILFGSKFLETSNFLVAAQRMA